MVLQRNFVHCCIISLLVLCSSASALAVDVSGYNFADELKSGSQKLLLNGVGIRHKYFLEIYAIGLYLTERHDVTADIVAAPGPQRINVTMLREIASDELGKAMLAGMRANMTTEETLKVGPDLITIGRLFGSLPGLKKGDTFSLDWTPGVGAVIFVNGKAATEPMPDKLFFDGLMKIWIGDNPVDTSLKPYLLGAKKID